MLQMKSELRYFLLNRVGDYKKKYKKTNFAEKRAIFEQRKKVNGKN